MDNIILKSNVENDDYVKYVSSKFDYVSDGSVETKINVPVFPKDFQIGLIVGTSGSGKTTLLKNVLIILMTISHFGTVTKQLYHTLKMSKGVLKCLVLLD